MRLLAFLLFISFISCKKEILPVTLSAEIANIDVEEISIVGFDYKKELSVTENKVNDTLMIRDAGLYSFRFGRNGTTLYLAPGDVISIKADAKDFDKTLEIVGPHNAIQEYLTAKNTARNALFTRDLYAMDPDAFYAKIEAAKDTLNKIIANADLPADFAAFETKNVNYEGLKQMFIYPDYADKNIDSLPEVFQNPLEGVDLTNEKEYLASSEYKSLVGNHFNMVRYRDTTESYEDVFLSHISKMAPGNIRDQLLYGDMRYMMGPNENLEKMYAFFKEHSANSEHLEKMTESYNDLIKLKKGELSPKFDYENYAGGKTTLDDLAGKYVYVDVWATWCGPCKAEIPSLKKVEAQYHDKNIEFVSISVDNEKDYDKWRAMIAEKELGGIQLMSDKAWESKFVQDYKINGIPRFILIDPAGKIVTADAPRPSDEKLIKTLDGLEM